MARKAKYVLTAGTVVWVSAAAVDSIEDTVPSTDQKRISTTAKEISYTGGQKSDLDMTVLESDEQEMENGLRAMGELTISGNWKPDDEGQDSLRAADADDSLRLMNIKFKSGSSVKLLVQVRQDSWQIAQNGVASGTFNLRVVGKPTYAAAPVGGGGE
ncbi:phage tail tube protein [Vreelandella malpeensis]|uniref:Phage tail protein n=1 Tax=Vreelandella malpeensis TaxID=1172368 RepID=A0ABS8DUC3_9GAMM|nr:phage tail tube protein [Halomonas malpeensis]MCB8889931.1 phage tail protein [Halomonas malpeensis]